MRDPGSRGSIARRGLHEGAADRVHTLRMLADFGRLGGRPLPGPARRSRGPHRRVRIPFTSSYRPLCEIDASAAVGHCVAREGAAVEHPMATPVPFSAVRMTSRCTGVSQRA